MAERDKAKLLSNQSDYDMQWESNNKSNTSSSFDKHIYN